MEEVHFADKKFNASYFIDNPLAKGEYENCSLNYSSFYKTKIVKINSSRNLTFNTHKLKGRISGDEFKK